MSIEVHKCPDCGHHFFWPVRHLADGSHSLAKVEE